MEVRKWLGWRVFSWVDEVGMNGGSNFSSMLFSAEVFNVDTIS